MAHSFLRILRGSTGIVLTLAVIAGIGYLALGALPDWLEQSERLEPDQLALERARNRTAALVFLGGIVAAAGAVFAGLTFNLSRRGQGTDRFNKAIELTGQGDPNVRLGGIHALEQLASDDPRRHHRAVVEVLLAYVPRHSARPLPAAGQQSGVVAGEVPLAPADVKAAMAVLARRKTRFDPRPLFIDLSNTNLRGIAAQGIDLRHALLDGAQLQDADLKKARLEGATLVSATVDGAELDDATLDENTSFERASVIGTSFVTTKGVHKADFTRAVHDWVTTSWPDDIPPARVVANT